MRGISRRTLSLLLVVALIVLGQTTALGQSENGAESGNQENGPEATADEGSRELVHLRTRTSRILALDSGLYEAQIAPGSIHFKDSESHWRPIDNTLVPSTKPGYSYENAANGYKLYLPSRLEEMPIRVEVESHWVSYQLRGASGTPEVDANRATYVGAFPGVSVQYEAASDAAKESLVLSGPVAPQTFVYDIRMGSGVTAIQHPDDSVVFRDEFGSKIFSFADPFMFDSSNTELGYSNSVSAVLSQGSSGLSLTLSADPAWLTSPQRVWPVVVDPTTELNPTTDCMIANEGNANTSFCGSTVLKVGTDGAGTMKRRTVMKFNLSSIPHGARVVLADLELFLSDATTSNPAAIDIHRLTTDWMPPVTWESPWTNSGGDAAFGATAASNTMGGSAGSWKHWYPNNLIDFLVEGSYNNFGLILKQRTEGVNNVLSFASVDSATNKPKLRVRYDAGIGELPYFTFDSQQLSDRTGIKVNVANGNLLLKQSDLSLAGDAGHGLTVDRYYNSLSTADPASKLGTGWVMGTGSDVDLDFSSPDVIFKGPSGYHTKFDFVSTNVYDPPRGVDADLTKNNTTGEWELKFMRSKTKMIFADGTEAGRLLRVKDKNGNEISYTYNTDGSLQSITDTQGRVVNFGYVGGHLRYMHDVAGKRLWTYYYGDVNLTDSGNLLTAYCDPVQNGVVTTPPSDPTQCGSPVEFLYEDTLSGDEDDFRLVKVVTSENRETIIGYESSTSHKVATITRVNPTIQDVLPEGASAPDALNSTTSYIYFPNDDGAPCTKGELGNDVRGRTEMIDPNGSTTKYCYDKHLQIQKVIDALGKVRKSSYNGRGNIDTYSDEATVTTPYSFTFDGSGNDMTGTQSAEGSTTTINYGTGNNAHLPTSMFSTQNKTSQATYEYRYTSNQNLKCAIDANDNTWTYRYTSTGELDKVYDAAALSGVSTPCDTPSGPHIDYNYTYGAGGEIDQITITPADTSSEGVTTVTFDDVGRTATVTDGSARTSSYQYDALDRVVAIDFTIGTESGSVDNTYDLDGNLDSTDDDEHGGINYTYDGLNRMFKETPAGSNTATNTYLYDKAGNLRRLSDSGGDKTYTYTALNMVKSLSDADGNTTKFCYEAGRGTLRTLTAYPNNVEMAFTYDKDRQMQKITTRSSVVRSGTDPCASSITSSTPIYELTYSFNDEDNGNVRSSLRHKLTTELGTGTPTDIDFDYTANDRLKKVSNLYGDTYDYGYTQTGNLLRRTVNPGVSQTETHFAYDHNDQLLCSHSVTGCATTGLGTAYNYDMAGNLTDVSGASGFELNYNAKAQTDEIIPSGLTSPQDLKYRGATQDELTDFEASTIGHNVLGLSIQSTQSQGAAHENYFLRDDKGTLVELRDKVGGNFTHYYYLFDAQGSVMGLTDDSGALVAPAGASLADKLYRFDPYGKELNDPVGTTVFNPFGYAGGYMVDRVIAFTKPSGSTPAKTSLIKFGTRYYDPITAHWTQKDPVSGKPSQPLTLNPYLYVNANPVNGTDPTGRFGLDDAFGFLDESLGWASEITDLYDLWGCASGSSGCASFALGQLTTFTATATCLAGAAGLAFVTAGVGAGTAFACTATGIYLGEVTEYAAEKDYI
jgi:RHS repeat-associated protein